MALGCNNSIHALVWVLVIHSIYYFYYIANHGNFNTWIKIELPFQNLFQIMDGIFINKQFLEKLMQCMLFLIYQTKPSIKKYRNITNPNITKASNSVLFLYANIFSRTSCPSSSCSNTRSLNIVYWHISL